MCTISDLKGRHNWKMKQHVLLNNKKGRNVDKYVFKFNINGLLSPKNRDNSLQPICSHG